MRADFIHYAHVCSCGFTYEFFCAVMCSGFLQVYLPFFMNSDIYYTSFIVRSVHVMRPGFSFIFVFSSKTFQFFLSCFLSLSNNLKPTTRTTNNISETFSLSLSLLFCSYQPRFSHKSRVKWPFIYKFLSAYISEFRV
jgi:hypothetical protein